jgi:hypothetical protein
MTTPKIGVKQKSNRYAKTAAKQSTKMNVKHQKLCVNCGPPNDEHSSFDKDCPKRTKENIITRMKIDRGISYGMARNIFDQKIDNAKQSYAEAAGKIAENLA